MFPFFSMVKVGNDIILLSYVVKGHLFSQKGKPYIYLGSFFFGNSVPLNPTSLPMRQATKNKRKNKRKNKKKGSSFNFS
jgi:hypothetical protein